MNRPSLHEAAARLIAADTVSSRGNAGAMEMLAGWLEDAGMSVRLQRWGEGAEAKANLVASAGPPEPGGLILSGHLDVVPFAGQPGWTRDPLRLTPEGGRCYGRGASDMKVFLAQCVEAVGRLPLDRLARPLVLLFTSDEEIGCLGAARLAPALPELLGHIPLPRLCWIGEPTSWRVFHTHKGIVSFGVRVRGRGGHSSLPQEGVNAIAVAARLLAKIGALQSGLRSRPQARFAGVFPQAPYTTLNIGQIQGGTALNMIAEECAFTVSYRPLPDEPPQRLWERVRELLCAPQARDWGSDLDAHVEVGPPDIVPGLLAQRGSALELALRAETGDTREGGAPFCTDAGRFAEAGITSIICGPGDLDQAHQPDESISQTALETGPARILAVARQLCAAN
ncbi:MAG: acetylornithine deacetylase [Deltaproteobacteria bacterium]|nr:acetylornithine deacetylase [Deltaproteobacteria bacterium]MDD9872869.1 acetylornithine deacetylase [Deltaproteobacteria bacterium]